MSSGGSEDFYSSRDEVKVYKDEGNKDEEERSSENLTEEKLGLVTESEEGKSASLQGNLAGSERSNNAVTDDGECRFDAISYKIMAHIHRWREKRDADEMYKYENRGPVDTDSSDRKVVTRKIHGVQYRFFYLRPAASLVEATALLIFYEVTIFPSAMAPLTLRRPVLLDLTSSSLDLDLTSSAEYEYEYAALA
ncbi:protein fam149b1-like isoform x2 [Plakobranchus ocellatus]|uniref:Protein fam149b1-like isoform x2 n=1 Tax=Plakobranchus ocellatus TaxID=259542 RepID=A0AAV4D5G4_9GAST|nr:protein fam149b1-like isoform x2 [Plakobranchus ocellatus]